MRGEPHCAERHLRGRAATATGWRVMVDYYETFPRRLKAIVEITRNATDKRSASSYRQTIVSERRREAVSKTYVRLAPNSNHQIVGVARIDHSRRSARRTTVGARSSEYSVGARKRSQANSG